MRTKQLGLDLSNRVSQAYARDGEGPAVYGRYKEHGYKVQPLIDKVGTRITENVSGTEAFRIAGLDWTVEKRQAAYMGADGWVTDPTSCSIVRSETRGRRFRSRTKIGIFMKISGGFSRVWIVR